MQPIALLLVLLAVLVAAEPASAQCVAGTLAFRIVDTRTGDVRPRVSDLPGSSVESMEIAGMTLRLSTIERDLVISLDSGYFAGGSPVFQSLNPRGLRSVMLEVDRGAEKMELLITNVAPRECYLLDAIPFRPGYWTLDLEPARRDERGFRRLASISAEMREASVKNLEEPSRTSGTENGK